LIDSTVQTIRRIATDLRPGILDDFGLMAAIEWQLQEFQTRAGIECRLSSKVGHLNLDPETSTALFRVFQETLTNVARHANATQVEVLLEEQPNALLLQVRDNGRGISERETFGTKSLGLLGIRERVRLLSGELSIQGNPGKGTTVQVRIPLDGSQPGQSASETEPAQ
jgi:signal transduction histidine kinase